MTWQKNDNGRQPVIVHAGALDGDCFDITLDNGHTILLELHGRIHEPAFAALIQDKAFDKPQTDGRRIFWRNGPSFTLAEIFEMLTECGEAQFEADK